MHARDAFAALIARSGRLRFEAGCIATAFGACSVIFGAERATTRRLRLTTFRGWSGRVAADAVATDRDGAEAARTPPCPPRPGRRIERARVGFRCAGWVSTHGSRSAIDSTRVSDAAVTINGWSGDIMQAPQASKPGRARRERWAEPSSATRISAGG